MPEWIVSIIVAFCVIFIVLGATFGIAVLMHVDEILDTWRDMMDRKYREKK